MDFLFIFTSSLQKSLGKMKKSIQVYIQNLCNWKQNKIWGDNRDTRPQGYLTKNQPQCYLTKYQPQWYLAKYQLQWYLAKYQLLYNDTWQSTSYNDTWQSTSHNDTWQSTSYKDNWQSTSYNDAWQSTSRPQWYLAKYQPATLPAITRCWQATVNWVNHSRPKMLYLAQQYKINQFANWKPLQSYYTLTFSSNQL